MSLNNNSNIIIIIIIIIIFFFFLIIIIIFIIIIIVIVIVIMACDRCILRFLQISSVWIVCWFVGCLTSQQHASVSQGQICPGNFMCCHTEIEVADQTVYLTQSQYTDTGLTSPSADPVMPGTWQGSHWRANFDSTRKNPVASRIRTPDLPLPRRTP